MIHHVFLPPRLPQEDDMDGRHLLAMVRALRDSVSDFLTAETASLPSVQPALAMLDRFLKTKPRPDGSNTADTAHLSELRSAITDLKDGGKCLFFPCELPLRY
jgi:hypothetical protein